MQQGRFIFPIQAVSHRSEWCSDWLKGKRNNNCCDRAYIFVMLCRLSLTSWPHFFQDELIVSLNSQHKCQWRIQQSRLLPFHVPQGDAVQLGRRTAGSWLRRPWGLCCWGAHWLLGEAQGGQALEEGLGTCPGPSARVRQLFEAKAAIRKAWLNIQLIMPELASPLCATKVHAAFRDKANGARLTGRLGLAGCLGAAIALLLARRSYSCI